MSSSSQQITSSVTSSDIASLKFDDVITLTGTDTFNTSSVNTITLTGTGSNYNWNYGTTGTIGSGISTVSIGPITINDIKIDLPEEWKDCFPAWSRVEDMCKQYPALEIALRNFRTVYELVKDDYDNPTPKK